MEFYHFSKKIIKHIKESELTINIKPTINILWLSCNDDWIKFMKKENINKLYKYKYLFRIDITKLIILKTFNDIIKFDDKYGYNEKIKNNVILKFIDWNKVKKDGYYGIYVKNANIKKARSIFLWYSSFDICSVAIWDKKAIISFSEPIKIS